MPSFQLTLTPPFRLDLTSWILRRRPNNTWDLWDGETYRRMLVIEGLPVGITAVQRGQELVVTLEGARISSEIKEQVIAGLRRLLGIDVDLSPFYRFARTDRRLAPLAERFRGFKPPRFFTLQERLGYLNQPPKGPAPPAESVQRRVSFCCRAVAQIRFRASPAPWQSQDQQSPRV